jgi:hypothetical protein
MYVLGGECGFLHHHRGGPSLHHSENNSCQDNTNTSTFLNGTFIGGNPQFALNIMRPLRLLASTAAVRRHPGGTKS